ncbi:unnamed protein product [Rhizophagus irregularis]|nr:unnamed protein product [Rhizophagus irregularis]
MKKFTSINWSVIRNVSTLQLLRNSNKVIFIRLLNPSANVYSSSSLLSIPISEIRKTRLNPFFTSSELSKLFSNSCASVVLPAIGGDRIKIIFSLSRHLSSLSIVGSLDK